MRLRSEQKRLYTNMHFENEITHVFFGFFCEMAAARQAFWVKFSCLPFFLRQTKNVLLIFSEGHITSPPNRTSFLETQSLQFGLTFFSLSIAYFCPPATAVQNT